MSDRYRITWTGMNVTVHGVDFSGKLTIHMHHDKVLVVKKAAGSCWSGVGMAPRYVPASFLVFKATSKEYWELITRFPINRPKENK